METLLVPLRLLWQAAFVRNLDLLQRRVGSDLEQLSWARTNLYNWTYINENMRKDMQQSFEESVKGGPEEAAKLLAAAIVGERSRTSAGVSAERDAEARGGRHAAYRDLIAPSVISMRAIPKHLSFVHLGCRRIATI
jgi:hypothetical protein